jgi:SAM-dependent methyltransferase
MATPADLNTIHPERALTGFTRLDGTVRFYSFVKAIMRQLDARRVMDFGAGRGAWQELDAPWLRELHDLRQYGATVIACDVDTAVLQHSASHEQVVLDPDGPLPFEDGSFDMIVSDRTFEHLEDPAPVARELLRVLRPGGFICARTPNRYGYVTMLAQLVPNRRHVALLSRAQPDRQARDVFPTYFRLNSVRDMRRHFPGCEVTWFRDSAEPSYYFGNPWLYRMGLLVHRLLPDALATSLCVMIRKPA